MECGDLRDVRCERCDAGTGGFDPGEEVFLRENGGTGSAIVGQPVVGFRVIGASGVIRQLVVQRSGGLQVLCWLEIDYTLKTSLGHSDLNGRTYCFTLCIRSFCERSRHLRGLFIWIAAILLVVIGGHGANLRLGRRRQSEVRPDVRLED